MSDDQEWANQSLRRALQDIQDAATKPLHVEIEFLRTDYVLLSDDYKQLLGDNERLRSELAEARGAIESAVRCLTMCNDGPREALLILNAYKSRNREWRTDSTSEVKP
jgi:hypothetical protein